MIRNLVTNSHLDGRRLSCRCALRCYSSSFRTPQQSSEDVPHLPRYVRRETLSKSGAVPLKKRDNDPLPQKVFRSRHFDPSKDQNSKSGQRLLEPHTLSSRLKKLCDANNADEAVSMLKTSPRDAQNAQVWNTLIWECMKDKRFNLGYQLYTDMKRRGFSPTTRTFQTMFTGLSKVDNWAGHTKQLTHAHSLYDAFQRHIASVKKHDPDSAELTSTPLSGYIKILSDNGFYQEIFDVYYALPSDGPAAPNELIYTAMFQALASIPRDQDSTSLMLQNASNAKLLWMLMQKALKKSTSFSVDTYVVTAAISALSRGETPEFDLAFQIAREYYGLKIPGEPFNTGVLPLSQQSLDVIFRLCNTSGKYALCQDFLQQVKSRSVARGGAQVLDHGHLNEVLKARIALPEAGAAYYCLEILEWMLRQEIIEQGGPKIRPTPVTYNLVLTACWRGGDWRSAARVFDLMTGYHSHDFMDGAVSKSPRRDARSTGRNLDPSPETLHSLIGAALASHDRANVRQALRIVDFFAGEQLMAFYKMDSNSGSKARAYFISKLASSVVKAVSFVSGPSTRSQNSRDEMEQWKRLADIAVQVEKRTV